MTTLLTMFTATLVQDSALSISGLDREAISDQPFAVVDGVPTLVGRGLKGAAVAMARRFFDPLPRAVSDDITHKALRRSAWEFSDATATGAPRIRAGVGIHHKTGARAGGVLHDREVIPARTKWKLEVRADRSYALDDAEFSETEGILGYVLQEHWAKGRCWLGGGAARGLGWCHLEDLKAYRFDRERYDAWIRSGRSQVPAEAAFVPVVSPTRSWYFRTLDVDIEFGEYRPDPKEAAWGLDMLAVGAHDTERTVQQTGSGKWAKPAWATNAATPYKLTTDRAILMDGDCPLLPGSSVRGPLRHAFSRAENTGTNTSSTERQMSRRATDPHLVKGDVALGDLAGEVFGTISKSSRVLIRDARADGEWAAAKLHMHAEDEFSAGSYESAKRDAVRVLQGTFAMRIVVEGDNVKDVEQLKAHINRQVALGELRHLPVGGHKTRGAGAGCWRAKSWVIDDVTEPSRTWAPPKLSVAPNADVSSEGWTFVAHPAAVNAWVRTKTGAIEGPLTRGIAAARAKEALGERLTAWWCEPTIDLDLRTPPGTFGQEWPSDDDSLQTDEIAFYAERAMWRASRTATGARFVYIEELATQSHDTTQARVTYTPARLHGFTDGPRPRFSSAPIRVSNVLLREWHIGDQVLGFTLTWEQR